VPFVRRQCRSPQLHALAYNFGNFLRTLATPEPIKDWSLTSLKERLMKIGAKVVSHGRYIAFQMTEGRDPEKPLYRDPAADRGTAAAARHLDDVKRSVSPVRQNRQEECVLVKEDLALRTFDAAT
jgi:hypothetical protein